MSGFGFLAVENLSMIALLREAPSIEKNVLTSLITYALATTQNFWKKKILVMPYIHGALSSLIALMAL